MIESHRLQQVPPYAFAAISQRVRELQAEGYKVIRLDMGSPDMPPPTHVVDQLAQAAAQPDVHGYAGFAGIPSLRKAFADYYQHRFYVALDPEQHVLPLIGSKEGIAHSHLALLNPGDIALVPDPGYIAYVQGVRLAGATPVAVPLRPENRYIPDLQAIPADARQKARIMWINYPNNPTGATIDLSQLTRIVEFCREHDILLLSDNPYADVYFTPTPPPSILQVPGALDVAVEFSSLSKTYNMAGWRVGVCVGHPAVVAALLKLKSNMDSGSFKVIQIAAVAALENTPHQWVQQRNNTYAKRRDALIKALPTVGLSAYIPEGSLYIWAQVENGMDDVEYVHTALEEAHISMVPGRVYGEQGKGFVRISFVQPIENIQAAIDRLQRTFD